jgi:hypothetical protein
VIDDVDVEVAEVAAARPQEAVEALEKGWRFLPVGGCLQSVPAAVWLGESYRVLGDVRASKEWWEVAGEGDGYTWRRGNPYLVDAKWPNRRLDYLFVSWPRQKAIGNPSSIWLAGLEPVDGVQASDHAAVVANIYLGDEL